LNIIKRDAEVQTQPNGLTDLCNDRSLMVAIGAIGMPTDRANFEIVTPEGLERELNLVRASAVSSRSGIFGAQSAIWHIDREAAIFLGAGRALLLQLAHPWVAAAIDEHSNTFTDPIGRFHRTFGIVFNMVFGSLEDSLAVARQLHRRHQPRIETNDVHANITLAERGNGITMVLSYMVRDALRSGKLVPVLQIYAPPPVPVHLIYAQRRIIAPKVRAFIDFATPRLRSALADPPQDKGAKQVAGQRASITYQTQPRAGGPKRNPGTNHL
jgi:hypothetical protein